MATAATATKLLFPWRDAYSVGIPQIDSQHQVLIRLINELHEAMAAGHGKQVLGRILDELVNYTKTHFASEESMLMEKGFAGLGPHRMVHQKLTGQVIELRDKYRANQITLTLEVMQFLRNWLADHIMVHDQAYAKALKSQ